jgi:hypothetical protein
LGLAVALVATLGSAVDITRTKDIRANPMGFVNNVVTVEGFVTQWVEGQGTTNFYVLKDDWGGVIKVRTSRERPIVSERYRVSGPVGIDVVNRNDVFISEEQRVEFRATSSAAAPTAAPVVQTPTPLQPPPPGLPIFLILAIVVVLIILLALLAWLALSRRRQPAAPLDASVPLAGAPEGDAPAAPIEGRTIKIFAPPPGTLKILPGRLAVLEGDETVKEIRFYKVKGQTTPEMTFGRATGAPFTHVQLKPMTVSSRQAKLTFINNQWILTNHAPAASNPTRINGTELQVDGQTALNEGDRVQMGEVVFEFHLS